MSLGMKSNNQHIQSTSKSPKNYDNTGDDRFSKTDWVTQNSYHKSANESKPMSQFSNNMGFTSTSNNFR